MPYTVPDTLAGEIDELEEAIRRFEAGELDAGIMKAKRVPFGVYEQRREGTYMVRVRCTGGTVTPRQLVALAGFSERFGSPFLHLTTRQDIQIHDVAIGRVPELQRALLSEGLSSRGGGGNTVRNILGSPESGYDPDEPFAVGPWLDALTDRLVREKDSWNLPRKYKISFASSFRDSALAGFNDLGFYPVPGPAGEPGFEVWAAGGLGGKPRTALLLRPWIPASEAHVVAYAIKKFFDAHGNRRNKRQARLRFLRDRFGDEGLVERLNQAIDEEKARGFQPLVPRPRPAPRAWNGVAAEATEAARTWMARNATVREGLALVRIPVLLGDLPSATARALGEALEGWGEDVVRLGMRQDLLLVGVPEGRLPELHALLAPLDLARLSGGVEEVVACTGADTCKLGLCLPKGATRALVEAVGAAGLPDDAFSGLRVHVSGCPNSCAQHMLADLGFFGAARRQGERMYPSYRVVVGGRLGRGRSRLARDVGQVAARHQPAFVAAVAKAWREDGAGDFGEWIERGGEDRVKALAEPFSAIPDWEVDASGYTDWGAVEPFSPTRGGAECSAGLFDLIEIDRSALERLGMLLDRADVTESDIKAAVFHASRMLLVARGIEPDTPSGVYDGFLHGFLDQGLVAETHRGLVLAARSGEALAGRAGEAKALAGSVEALYQSMDDSLRFTLDLAAPAPSAPSAHAEPATKDLRGVACPLNYAKARIALEDLPSGAVLRILLDDGEPIRNVPGSLASEGHAVSAPERSPEGHWSLEVRKA